jgi:hypothetical protein
MLTKEICHILGFRFGKFKDVFWDVKPNNVPKKHQDFGLIFLRPPPRMKLARGLCFYLSNYSK